MQFILNYLLWSPDPDIFTIPLSFLGLEDRPVRWYGLLFAGGFILSQQVLFRIFKKEGYPEKDVEKLTVYMVIAVIAGARLGHCLFYNPSYYLSNPIEIIKVWEGGLASHGGAIGILVALWLFSRKYKQYKMRWLVDRLVIVVALTGAMIRTGNFFNSEMEGVATNSNVGVVYAAYTAQVLDYGDNVESVSFEKDGNRENPAPGKVPVTAVVKYKKGYDASLRDKTFIETNLKSALYRYTEINQHIDFGEGPLSYQIYKKNGQDVLEIYGVGTVRHAAQLYEAAYCVVLMLLLYWIWKEKRFVLPAGFAFGLFMFLLWTLRFCDEFFKMNQEAFEDNLALNMGQILSIPMALLGVGIMIYTMKANGPRMAEKTED
ncbi:MAG: prolipoprotein diacylglyceryl transferase [Cyclobacteriaceae bacterium]